jgi:serine/threonine-protein kinase
LELARAKGTSPTAQLASLGERRYHSRDRTQFPLDNPLERISAALAGRYAIERELGRGGAATVYLAADLKHARKVAIKVLHAEIAAGLGAERFLREVQITAQLQHPHVLTLIDSGEADGQLYYVMPYVEGESLRTRLAREGELPIDEVLRLTRDVVDGLAHAHAHGLVHRDIKPENVLLSGRHAIVTDFGVAKAVSVASGAHGMTTEGVALGTPAYMAPEQAVADPNVDRRADIYAVGVLIYEMLTGRPPFTGVTSQAVLAAHITETPRDVTSHRPSVPPALGAMVMRCLAKKPADRPQTAEDLLHQLDSLITPTSGFTPATMSGSRVQPARAHRLGIIGAAAALVVALGAWYLATRARGPVVSSASTIVVLPIVPAAADTALARLGRDLVVTLSTNLDGAGPIRTIDALTSLAQVQPGAPPLSLQAAVALGRKLGAASVVQGSLVRAGELVRLDVGLYKSTDASALARVAVTASPNDLVALTDSATWALLRAVWRGADAPTPSLGAVTTRSVPALKAFLAGEQAILENKWVPAAEAFAAATAADSSFWWAYCRYRYVRGWIGLTASLEGQMCTNHLAELPERERLLQSVGERPDSATPLTETLRIQRMQAITQRFPDYWPGWFALGDRILHSAIPAGFTLAESRAALERATVLNPRLIPAWEHLSWIYSSTPRDTALLRISLDTIRALGGFLPGQEASPRIVEGLIQGKAPRPASLDTAVKRIIDVARSSGMPAEWTNGDIMHYGFPATEIEMSRRILREPNVPPALIPIHERGIAWAFIARGAWDSALVSAETFARRDTAWARATEPYRIAVLGVLFGGLDDSVALALRPASAAASARAPTTASRSRQSYLDGLLAVARRDSAGIAAVRAGLASFKDSVDLDQVFAAFELERRGDVRGAAALLREQDMRVANGLVSAARVGNDAMFGSVNRLILSQWFATIGDTATAVSLLNYFDNFASGVTFDAAATLGSLAMLQRARLADGQRKCEQAKQSYEEFRRRYDMPVAKQKHLVDDANASLARLRVGEPRCVAGK